MDQRILTSILEHATFGYAVYHIKPSIKEIKLLTSNDKFN